MEMYGFLNLSPSRRSPVVHPRCWPRLAVVHHRTDGPVQLSRRVPLRLAHRPYARQDQGFQHCAQMADFVRGLITVSIISLSILLCKLR